MLSCEEFIKKTLAMPTLSNVVRGEVDEDSIIIDHVTYTNTIGGYDNLLSYVKRMDIILRNGKMSCILDKNETYEKDMSFKLTIKKAKLALKKYTIMGSMPGDGGVYESSSPKCAFIEYLRAEGVPEFELIRYGNSGEFEGNLGKVGDKCWAVGDYEIKELSDDQSNSIER